MTDQDAGSRYFEIQERAFEATLNIASELERIANRLTQPMTKPWEELLGELRVMNRHLELIVSELYGVRDELKKHRS